MVLIKRLIFSFKIIRLSFINNKKWCIRVGNCSAVAKEQIKWMNSSAVKVNVTHFITLCMYKC